MFVGFKKFICLAVNLFCVSLATKMTAGRGHSENPPDLTKWFNLFPKTDSGVPPGICAPHVDDSPALVLQSVFSESLVEDCRAVTFQHYIEDLIRKQQHEQFPRTWIDNTFLYNFTAYDEFDEKSKKIFCPPKNITTDRPVVQLVNSSVLLEKLGSKNDSVTSHYCAVVMFYAPWCPFCARVAPQYNALARAFPTLDVFAIDALSFSKFGTVAVPNILVFHQSKAVARFNGSERTLENLRSFVQNVTGVDANESVVVAEEDYIGPLSSTASDAPDYFLWFSWAFVLVFMGTCFARSSPGRALWVHAENLFGGHIEQAHIE